MCPDERGLGALARSPRSFDRASLDSARVGCVGLLTRRKVEHHPGFVEGILLVVASFLRVIQSLLADVTGDLFAIDPGLAIIKDAGRSLTSDRVGLALLIVVELLLIDPCLVSIGSKLLSVADRLLELSQALLPGQL